MSSTETLPFCLGLNVLEHVVETNHPNNHKSFAYYQPPILSEIQILIQNQINLIMITMLHNDCQRLFFVL